MKFKNSSRQPVTGQRGPRQNQRRSQRVLHPDGTPIDPSDPAHPDNNPHTHNEDLVSNVTDWGLNGYRGTPVCSLTSASITNSKYVPNTYDQDSTDWWDDEQATYGKKHHSINTNYKGKQRILKVQQDPVNVCRIQNSSSTPTLYVPESQLGAIGTQSRIDTLKNNPTGDLFGNDNTFSTGRKDRDSGGAYNNDKVTMTKDADGKYVVTGSRNHYVRQNPSSNVTSKKQYHYAQSGTTKQYHYPQQSSRPQQVRRNSYASYY